MSRHILVRRQSGATVITRMSLSVRALWHLDQLLSHLSRLCMVRSQLATAFSRRSSASLNGIKRHGAAGTIPRWLVPTGQMPIKEEHSMWEIVILNAVCLVLALVALGIALWAVLSGQLFETGVDGLFLVLVCLLIAVVFSVPPLVAIRRHLQKLPK